MTTKQSGIYLITVRRPNGLPLYYVGQSQDLGRRIRQHNCYLRCGSHFNRRLLAAYRKYGKECFTYEVLEVCEVKQLDEFELWWLQQIVGHKRVCNFGTDPVAPMRGVRFSDEHRRKISEAHSGDKHYSRGRGPMPAEHREAISRGNLGKIRSEESKIRYSHATRGSKNAMFGKVGALNVRSRAVVGKNLETGEIIYFSSAGMAKIDGFDQGAISRCCNGNSGVHKGYYWAWYNGGSPVFNTVDRKALVNNENTKTEHISPEEREARRLESNRKISLSKMGENNHFFGKSGALSPVACPVIGTSLSDGSKISFETMAAAKAKGFSPSKISLCCGGHRTSHRGFSWEKSPASL